MIIFTLAIISSSIIFVIFKLFAKFNVNTFQAIVFNYFTAFACGYLTSPVKWTFYEENLSNWGLYAFVCSILFISLFFVMGKSSQKNGVAPTSVAVKMSLGLSFIAMVFANNEELGILKIIGVLLAITGVVLMSISKNKSASEEKAGWMLIVLFVGSGMLDFILNYVTNQPFTTYNASMFTSFGFLFAGCSGVIVLLVNSLRGLTTIRIKNLIAGIILGIPNYFSIYFLLGSYSELKDTLDQSSILAALNVSIVLLSAIIGFFFMKEKFTSFKALGLASALLALYLLWYSSTHF